MRPLSVLLLALCASFVEARETVIVKAVKRKADDKAITVVIDEAREWGKRFPDVVVVIQIYDDRQLAGQTIPPTAAGIYRINVFDKGERENRRTIRHELIHVESHMRTGYMDEEDVPKKLR